MNIVGNANVIGENNKAVFNTINGLTGLAAQLSKERIKLIPVVSTAVKAIGYNPHTEVLYVEFNSAFYAYQHVSAQLWARITYADSIGQVINELILSDKTRDFTKVDLSKTELTKFYSNAFSNYDADYR